MADLPSMIEVAAGAAGATDPGQPIAAAAIAALRTAGIILPCAAVIDRIAITGRARARLCGVCARRCRAARAGGSPSTTRYGYV